MQHVRQKPGALPLLPTDHSSGLPDVTSFIVAINRFIHVIHARYCDGSKIVWPTSRASPLAITVKVYITVNRKSFYLSRISPTNCDNQGFLRRITTNLNIKFDTWDCPKWWMVIKFNCKKIQILEILLQSLKLVMTTLLWNSWKSFRVHNYVQPHNVTVAKKLFLQKQPQFIFVMFLYDDSHEISCAHFVSVNVSVEFIEVERRRV